MRIKIRHETNYSYGQPAQSALQLLRLTPRSSEAQFVRRWRVEVGADARLDRGEDAFGNITHLAFIDGPLDHVRIVIEGEVDTVDTGGAMPGCVERQPLGLYLRETALTEPDQDIKAFARDASARAAARAADGRLAVLHALNTGINRTFDFQIGATTSSTTAAQSFAARAGVCQDFAHVFIAATRSLGIPARYVSGYFLRTDTIDQEAGHAWAEAHIPDLGWIGFDPAQGLCTTDRYVRVAIGGDGNDAAPVRGARIGGSQEALSVAIQVQQGRTIVEG